MAKVWKKLTVTLTKEMTVGVDEECLTPEALELFSNYFWRVSDPDEIFDTIGDQYVRNGATFIEGVGKVSSWNPEMPVQIIDDFEDTEVEITDVKEEM